MLLTLSIHAHRGLKQLTAVSLLLLPQYFADQGWDMLVQLPWTKAAAAYGWQPQLLAEAVGRPPSFEVQFAMLVRM